MNKGKISTFEQEMQNVKFKKEFEEEYQEFLWSEFLIDLMEENRKSVRALAYQVGLSPTIIQNLRTGKQTDLKVSNLIGIAAACGYHLILQKGQRQIALS